MSDQIASFDGRGYRLGRLSKEDDRDFLMFNGYGKDTDKPSYLRSFRNALLEITGLLKATSRTSDYPLQAEAIRDEVQGKLDAIPNEDLKRGADDDPSSPEVRLLGPPPPPALSSAGRVARFRSRLNGG
jgi:hypothetical protein